jgi:cbb3-type cytochrome oxidase maturation protein
MESLFLLIPLAVLFTVLIANAFAWAVNNRQFEDLENASSRVLFDDDLPPPERPRTSEDGHD